MKRDDIQQYYQELRQRIEELHQKSISGHSRTAVLFSDLCGSTAYKNRREIITSLVKIYRHNAEAQDQVEKFGGRLIKSLGDGVMAAFEINEPDDISMVIDAAVRIQRRFASFNFNLGEEEQILSRIAISCGVVVDFGIMNPKGQRVFDPHGSIVDLAARLCSIARPCQILCDSETTKLLENCAHKFEVLPGGRRLLKGFPADLEVYIIKWAKDAPITLDYPDPTFQTQGFLTTDFVLQKVRDSKKLALTSGLSNRLFCDNTELLNVIAKNIQHNPSYRFEMVFLNPSSQFKNYSELMTRRHAQDLKPDILRNLKAACQMFRNIPDNVRIMCADFPMIIPLVRCDDLLLFSLPFRSREREHHREGVVGGPYFCVDVNTDLGSRILDTISSDRRIELPIVGVATGAVNVETYLESEMEKRNA